MFSVQGAVEFTAEQSGTNCEHIVSSSDPRRTSRVCFCSIVSEGSAHATHRWTEGLVVTDLFDEVPLDPSQRLPDVQLSSRQHHSRTGRRTLTIMLPHDIFTVCGPVPARFRCVPPANLSNENRRHHIKHQLSQNFQKLVLFYGLGLL